MVAARSTRPHPRGSRHHPYARYRRGRPTFCCLSRRYRNRQADATSAHSSKSFGHEKEVSSSAMFLGGGGDILDEFRRMERAMTRGAMDPRRTGGGAALASRSAGTNNNSTPPRCDTAAAATRTATGAAGPTPAATRTPPPRSTSSTPPSRAACTMGDTRSPRLRDRTGTQPEGRGTASRGPSATAAGASRASATAAPARNDARIDCSPRRTATGSTATGQPRRRRRS